jgi:hypothetical protein
MSNIVIEIVFFRQMSAYFQVKNNMRVSDELFGNQFCYQVQQEVSVLIVQVKASTYATSGDSQWEKCIILITGTKLQAQETNILEEEFQDCHR